jgi:hypothetical protein
MGPACRIVLALTLDYTVATVTFVSYSAGLGRWSEHRIYLSKYLYAVSWGIFVGSKNRKRDVMYIPRVNTWVMTSVVSAGICRFCRKTNSTINSARLWTWPVVKIAQTSALVSSIAPTFFRFLFNRLFLCFRFEAFTTTECREVFSGNQSCKYGVLIQRFG